MARAPYQVLVYPYRNSRNGQIEYALFKREDEGYRQGVTGGGENEEKPMEAAKRETYEESGISPASEFMQLDTVDSVPVTEFRDNHVWGDNI